MKPRRAPLQASVIGLECIRCGAAYPSEHYAEDCPRCRAAAPSNLTVAYAPKLRRSLKKPNATSGVGLWRYSDLLPIGRGDALTIGEGGTPLLPLASLGANLDIARLLGKDETRNPTWSFKDRLACVAVSVARRMGARVIVSSSTGNAGASTAAYAAKAGLACVILTAKGATGPLLTQMRVYGANVVTLEKKSDRWPLMQRAVHEFGWFPTSPFFGPVVGSNPYGLEGCKTLAYEIAEELDWEVPDLCVVPVCYGDALFGMWRGFEDMRTLGWTKRSPRLIAAEIYGSLTVALRDGTDNPPDMPLTHETVAKSTTATRSTYQALAALRRSGGTAAIVGNDSIMHWQQRLASEEGIYVEPASAGSIAAVADLRANGVIGKNDTVVVLLTASGLKDPAATAAAQGEIGEVTSDLEDAFALLQRIEESTAGAALP